MTNIKSADDYFEALPEDRKAPMNELRTQIRKNLPAGFTETMAYGMPAYVVPHAGYPAGYHCDPKQPLPFISLASQKGFIALYHMGIYASPELLGWFAEEYKKVLKAKPDMGKSCIRFKKPGQIPFQLIGQLAAKMTVRQWISLYEKNLKR
jgi:uncharacterized protein YdhG (YjbR/CyaY superfamily)